MSTFNILALPTFYNILEWVNSLKRNFNYCHNYRRLKLDVDVTSIPRNVNTFIL